MKTLKSIAIAGVALAAAISAQGDDSLLLHRWSFNNDLTDSVGGQTAWSTNTSFVAVGSGYAVKTEGGTNGTSYVNLGSNILPNDDRGFTFELWVRLDTWENAEYRMFTIGSVVGNKFDQTWGNQNQAGADYTIVTLLPAQNTYVVNELGIGPIKVGTFCHLAYVFTPSEDGHWTVRAYRHGVGTGILQAQTSFSAPHGWKPSVLDQANCNLVRSLNSGQKDSKASFDEIRVWGRALSERELAASAAAGPDAAIPDGDFPFGKTVYDTATGAVSIASAQTFADGTAKLSAGILGLSGANSALSLLAMYDGTIVQTGGSFAAADNRIAIGDGLCGIAALTATDGAELNVRGVAGNGLGEVVLNDATLRLSGETTTPTLVHRWSFNGDLADSVGGQTASQIGCSFEETGAGQGIKLSGGSHGTTCVDLGSNVVPTDGNGATIELWARPDSLDVKNVRMFDFGNSTGHSILLCWRAVEANTDYAIVRYSPQPQTLTTNELTPYSVGTMYHIALTVRQNGDGTWTVRAYKQDVKTGATLKATTFTAPAGWSLANFVQTHAYLGRAFDGDNTKDADATYDEVRIWNGVLTEAQLSANAVAGPDAPCGGEVKSGTAAVGGVTVRVGASGATIDTNGKEVEFTAPVSSLADGLVHRWSFNGDFSDSVGDQTATASGHNFVDLGDGKAVKLTGGARNTSCVDLGANVIPTNGTGATVELWGRNDQITSSERMFDVGNSVTNSIMMCWTSSANVNTDLLLVRNGRNSNGSVIQTYTQSELAPYVVGTEYHIAATYSPNPDGSWTVQGYKQNLTTGVTEKRSVLVPPSGWALSKVIQEHAYLGRSFDNSAVDSAATYNEVRIYNRALSEAELMASAVAGPDADLSSALVKTGAGTLTLCGTNTLSCPMRIESGVVKAASAEALSPNSVVELSSGTALDLGGCAVTAGGLTGSGVVSNGTLAVTGPIHPTGEIVLNGVAVSGTLEVSEGSGMLRCINGAMDLTGIVLDVKSATVGGQVVIECADGFTGDFAGVNVFSKSYVVRKKATMVKIARRGLVIIVK